MEKLQWTYVSEINCYVIHTDKPLQRPYKSQWRIFGAELWRLEMNENDFNSLTVDEIVRALNKNE